MAFNAKTYRSNKARKEAWKNLAAAREIKARAALGTAYDWEISISLPGLVRNAKFEMLQHLFYRA